MSTTDKELIAAGTNNHPPMLEESDFDSWKIRIQRYIRRKPNGKLIWNSIKNGPTPHPTTTDTMGEDKALLMEAKEKGVVLEAEAEAFLADVECTADYDDSLDITTTTAFKVRHEDAYDSNIDEAPHSAVVFMANLTGRSTGEATSNDTDFHSEEEQLDSDVDSDIDDYDNIISYHRRKCSNLGIEDNLFKEVSEYMKIFDELDKDVELKAEISKVKQLLVDKECKCSHIKMKYLNLELKFQKYKECFENPQLKKELTAVKIKNDSLRDENVSIKERFQELYKSKA
nr:hypothetical protein [Tanacetum cinerariifolium]